MDGTSRKPRRGTRRKRYGRRLHRKDVVIKKKDELLAQAEAEKARLLGQPVGIWAWLKQWWVGTSAQESELRSPSSD